MERLYCVHFAKILLSQRNILLHCNDKSNQSPSDPYRRPKKASLQRHNVLMFNLFSFSFFCSLLQTSLAGLTCVAARAANDEPTDWNPATATVPRDKKVPQFVRSNRHVHPKRHAVDDPNPKPVAAN